MSISTNVYFVISLQSYEKIDALFTPPLDKSRIANVFNFTNANFHLSEASVVLLAGIHVGIQPNGELTLGTSNLLFALHSTNAQVFCLHDFDSVLSLPNQAESSLDRPSTEKLNRIYKHFEKLTINHTVNN